MTKQELEQFIINTPDFPKAGVVFKDIFPLLKHKLPELMDAFANMTDWTGVDYIVGIESRGFILGSALAAKLNKGFIPIRKKGKLPPPVIDESYALEYGTDILEIQDNKDKKNIVIVDDVLATGGTLRAAKNLCEKANYNVKDSLVLINLAFLNEFKEEGFPVKSLLEY